MFNILGVCVRACSGFHSGRYSRIFPSKNIFLRMKYCVLECCPTYMFSAKYGFRPSELCAIILGSRMQTSDLRILLRKPPIHTQSSRIAQPNLGHLQILLCIITIYLLIVNHRCLQNRSACATVRSIVLHCCGWASCFACAIVHGFFAAVGRTALWRDWLWLYFCG